MAKKAKEKISIACAGCGRTQTLRKSKVVASQYFTCSYSCRMNPDWKHPYKPEGFIHVVRMNAAGAFYGHEMRPALPDEQAAVERAKAIEAEGLRQSLERKY